MNSCIYECSVMHHRMEKAERKFSYNYFMFYLDLDELTLIESKLKLFSYNKTNVYNFRDSDHLALNKVGAKENLLFYLEENDINTDGIKIRLLTNVATFGYNFNPVSFYYCFDKEDKPLCVVPEVGNTFHELKPFILKKESFSGNKFRKRVQKNFYVSPFLDHDLYFDFKLGIPGDKLSVNINDYRGDKKVFSAGLTGRRKVLNNANLIKYTLMFPLVTLQIIGAIHFQALLLILKKIPYFRKEEFKDKQKGMVLKWKKQ